MPNIKKSLKKKKLKKLYEELREGKKKNLRLKSQN
jgi:hypothetical protein